MVTMDMTVIIYKPMYQCIRNLMNVCSRFILVHVLNPTGLTGHIVDTY